MQPVVGSAGNAGNNVGAAGTNDRNDADRSNDTLFEDLAEVEREESQTLKPLSIIIFPFR